MLSVLVSTRTRRSACAGMASSFFSIVPTGSFDIGDASVLPRHPHPEPEALNRNRDDERRNQRERNFFSNMPSQRARLTPCFRHRDHPVSALWRLTRAHPVERRPSMDDVMPPRGGATRRRCQVERSKSDLCDGTRSPGLPPLRHRSCNRSPGRGPHRRSLAILHCGHLYEILIT